ncbi:MAG: CarD family transcriptional regulator [Candidatus Dojkabacteria bacterium]|nr:CarD family transcriptional regulator [Candidatus Dojkabacteria bacterium]
MELKVGSKVFYPSHGAAKVKAEKEIEFNGEKKKYFEFEFVTSPLSISTPVDNIDSLGIREILTITKIKDAMKELKKTPVKNPKVKDFNIMLNLFKSLEASSDIKASIEIIQYCNYVKKSREKEGRLIPISIEKQLEEAIKNIVGELAISADLSLEKASKSFSRSTGIEVDIKKD